MPPCTGPNCTHYDILRYMTTSTRYRTGAHTRYTINYHIVFCPKYKRKIFSDFDIEEDIKQSIHELSQYHDWLIEALEMDKDHLHICLSAPPRYSPANIVKLLKTWTYKQVYTNHKEIREYLWGGKMWCQGYYISTVSDAVTKREIKEYIKKQKQHQQQLSLFNSQKVRGD